MKSIPCKVCPVPADCERADNCAWDAADKIIKAEKVRPAWERDQQGTYDMSPRDGGRLKPGS